jgi:pimeloyl-ACP methyl ester carboxylesterase/uncharacterized protein YndB with AHSA1/START domain
MKGTTFIFNLAAVLTFSFFSYTQTVPVKSGYAPVNGLQLYYEIYGEGEPLVLLHGGLGAIEMFGSNIPALAEHYQVIAVDLQAHGATADIDRPIRIELIADDMAGLLEYLEIEKADFVGYSFGGLVSVQTAYKYPGLVRKLVIISSPFKRKGYYPEILMQQDQMSAESAEFLKQTPMYQLYSSKAPKVDDWSVLISKMGKWIKKDYDYSSIIKEIKSPAMVIAGDADIFPPSHAVELFNLLGGGLKDGGWDGSGVTNNRLAILPGLTHYNIFRDPRIAETVIPFLETMKSVVSSRVFSAPVEEVWKAWSESDYVKQWWDPAGFTCPVAEMNFREGGKSLVCMKWPEEMGGAEIYSTWTYTKIIPNEKIEFIFNFSDKDGNKISPSDIGMPDGIPDDVPHVITFKNAGNGKTEMTVSEYGYTNDQVVDLSKQGLDQSLDKMAAIYVK